MGSSETELMSFKQFVSQSEDNFDEDEAVKKYNSYKKDFKFNHVNKFFDAHKLNEWFKQMYDPELHKANLHRQQEAVRKRLEVFTHLYKDLGVIEGQPVEISNQAKLNEILDSAAIMVEGGSIEQLGEINQLDRSSKKGYQSNNFGSNIAGDLNNGISDTGTGKDQEAGSIWDQFIEKDNSSAKNQKTDDKSSKQDTMEVDDNDNEHSNVVDSNENHHQTEIKESYHKNASIFIKDYPETLSVDELVSFGSNYSGYKRAFIQQPSSLKNWSSRAWITFNYGVDITKICADFNKHVFSNGASLLGLVNRELQFRIRPVSGISNHKDIMTKDLKSAVNLVLLHDAKWGLFGLNDGEINEYPNLNNLTIDSANPLLANVASFVVEEADYDEDLDDNNGSGMIIDGKANMNAATGEVSGASAVENPYKTTNLPLVQFVSDSKLKEILDPILLYLRIVHSIDFYSATRINNESQTPHTIGLFHSRSDFVREHLNKKDFDEYYQTHSHRLEFILKSPPLLTVEKDIDYCTLRDPQKAVTDFIQSNSREISTMKWKCLVCDKKFRDFPFLQKHINNKHVDQLEKVKYECVMFNNYLQDPNRPGVFIQGMGRLTNSNNSTTAKGLLLKDELDTDAKMKGAYNNAVASLSSNPVLMATFINQVITPTGGIGASHHHASGPSFSGGIGMRHNNHFERRSITSYTDVDGQL